MSQMTKPDIAQYIADDLVHHLDEWYSQSETFDDELDRQINKWYANVPDVFPKRPYFSPSSASDCPRELYYKAKRYKKDNERQQPHTGRWKEIGTNIGSMIQRTILAMERSYKKKTGEDCKFGFERTYRGEPAFEDFVKRNVPVEHKGKDFHLFGTTDGIMTYSSPAGKKMRVGLEIKSKQTTPARTSQFSMRGAEDKHIKQCVAYSEMYDLDYFVILYINTSHKGWFMSEEEQQKNPDIRAFGIHIDDIDRKELFDYFADVRESVENNEPMPMDLDGWTFNNFKDVIVRDMTDEEFAEIEEYATKVTNSSLPKFYKANIERAYEDIKKRREVE